MSDSINLKREEIDQAFDVQGLREQFPPILSLEQVGQMLGYSRSTVYEWRDKGHLDCACRKRGKHVRCWRDRILDLYFNKPDWKTE